MIRIAVGMDASVCPDAICQASQLLQPTLGHIWDAVEGVRPVIAVYAQLTEANARRQQGLLKVNTIFTAVLKTGAF
jgi:hypothetical protein